MDWSRWLRVENKIGVGWRWLGFLPTKEAGK